MRLLIPKLMRDVCDHYEIAPSQMMPNSWRILLALERLSVQHRVECEIGEALFSYYLKEHDTDKGRYQLTARIGHVPIVTCLHTNNHSWKDRLFFVRGDLVRGPCGPGSTSDHWKTTSKDAICLLVPKSQHTLTFLFVQTANTTRRYRAD